ncbi:hypothetical protein ACJZ2D_003742 [Fusarium nematophilum]
MATRKPNQQLTPAQVFQTNFPFPKAEASPTPEGGASAEETEDIKPRILPHPSDFVQVEVCSELTSTTRALDIFGNAGPSAKETQQKLTLVHDKNGQPIVFTVSNTGRLYCVMHINNATMGWQSFDITPPGPENAVVDAFDTLEIGGKIHVVASVEVASEDGKLTQNVAWKEITNSIGDRNITSLLCCPSAQSAAGFQIIAGTATRDQYKATHYMLDPAAGQGGRWNHLVMSGSADELLAMQPVCLGNFSDKKREVGVASVFRQTHGNTQQVCSLEIFDEKSAQRVRTYVLQTGKLGSVKNICAKVNPWGTTDMVVAAEKGIGFYDANTIEALKVPPILPEISFKQAVCSEIYASPACKIAIFAISEQDQLYYIEGTRALQGNKLSFKASGIPIRIGVSAMSTQYNAINDQAEILYVSNSGSNGLRHLVRDPSTSLWSEAMVEVKLPLGTPANLDKVPVYMTTIALSNGHGVPVPEGYPIKVTCEPPVHVTCNGRSFLLNSRPTELKTEGGSGHIDLTSPVDPLLGTCRINVELSLFKPAEPSPEEIEIDPAQRVINALSSIKSDKDLQNARGPNGEVIFQDQSKIADSAKVLTQFGSMAATINGEKPTGAASNAAAAWERDGDKAQVSQDKSWFEEAVDTAGRFLGDAIECLKTVVKGVVKFAFKYVGKVVKFFLKIAGKVLSFTLKTVAGLLRTVAGFLKDHLGIDLSGLTKWLGLAFSAENAKKTQAHLLSTLNHSLQFTEDFLVHNKYRLADWMDDIEEKCKEYLPDARTPRIEKKEPGPISKIMNNPVVKSLMKFNPLAWILEGATEGLAEGLGDEGSKVELRIPSLQPAIEAFARILGRTVEEATSLVWACLKDVFGEIQTLYNDPSKLLETILRIASDVFYTAFDTIKTLVLAICDAVVAAFKYMKEFLNDVWKVPGLTDIWEDFTDGQEFTLLNLGTYCMALVINIGHIMFGDDRELPFDGIPAINVDGIPTPFIPTTRMEKLANQPPGPYDLTVMMAATEGAPPDYQAMRQLKGGLDIMNNGIRCFAGVVDTYKGAAAKARRQIEKETPPEPQHPLDKLIYGEDKTRNLEILTFKKAAPTQRMLTFGKVPLKTRLWGGFKNFVKNGGDIPNSLTIGISVVSVAMSITSFGMLILLPEEDNNKTRKVLSGVNVLCQLGALSAQCGSAREPSEVADIIGALLLQGGNLCEWAGVLVSDDAAEEVKSPVNWVDASGIIFAMGGIIAYRTPHKWICLICTSLDFFVAIGVTAVQSKYFSDDIEEKRTKGDKALANRLKQD